MFNLKLAAVSLNQTALDWEGNKERIKAALKEARRRGVQVLCLPEMAIPSYGCEDAFLSVHVAKTCEDILVELLPYTKEMVVAIGLPILYSKHMFAATAVCANGSVVGVSCKHILPGDGIHYEPRWFKQWPVGKRASFSFAGKTCPVGDLYYDIGGVHIGIEICEDAWSPQRFIHRYAGDLDIILNPSASHFAFQKLATRKRIVEEGSRAFGVAYAYANLLGNDSGRVIYDGGSMVAAHGKVIAQGQRFSYKDFVITDAIIDLEQIRTEFAARSTAFTVTEQNRERMVDCGDVTLAGRSEVPTEKKSIAAWEASPEIKCEEFARACSIGMFDYLRKSRSKGFVLSLSGGADSSSVAALVYMMCVFGIRDIGLDGIKERLSYAGDRFEGCVDVHSLVNSILTCVYQQTENNSKDTAIAARELCDAIGAQFVHWPVDDLIKGYVGLIETHLGYQPTWEKDDIALQNIQARVRSPGVWLLANLKSAILLNTSNRSEAAVGYTTMDGDSSGGLNPIGGIDKKFLREWLKWLGEVGPEGVGSVAGLDKVNSIQPTAELRPLSQRQQDEDDLMPYEILDRLEEWAIRDKDAPADVFEKLTVHYPDLGRAKALEYVEKFFRLWSQNQWKRERLAPSFHLDDTNLDPKTWCRFPILSGGFRTELARLKDGAGDQ